MYIKEGGNEICVMTVDLECFVNGDCGVADDGLICLYIPGSRGAVSTRRIPRGKDV